MKNYILFFIVALAVNFGNAQITYSPNPYILTGVASQYELTEELLISQSIHDLAFLHWKVIESESFPAEWQSQICDGEQCYNYDAGHSEKGNDMKKDSVYHWSVHVLPNGVAGNDSLTFEIYDTDFENKVETIMVYIHCNVAGVNDAVISKVGMYPNPANNYFRIYEDDNVHSIQVYNIIGKKLYEQSHTIGQDHDVSSLQDGLYLVRLLNENNEIIKVERLTKG